MAFFRTARWRSNPVIPAKQKNLLRNEKVFLFSRLVSLKERKENLCLLQLLSETFFPAQIVSVCQFGFTTSSFSLFFLNHLSRIRSLV